MKTIGIIGYGNMGSAIAAGIKSTMPDVTLYICEADEKKRQSAQDTLGAAPASSLTDLLNLCDITILAIKPQYMEEILKAAHPDVSNPCVISIAAGKSIQWISDLLKTQNVIRFMPNIAARVEKSLVAISEGFHVGPDFSAAAKSIAYSIGTPLLVHESLIPAITGISGSGIAFVFSFIHALAMGGTKSGIPYEEALVSAIATVEGAVALLSAEREHPISLLSKVTSAGGTTIEGVHALEEGAFTGTVMNAVIKAAERAKEL